MFDFITLCAYTETICNHFRMNSNKTNIRIKDIALKAGVSEGTVDRVLHNRGEVSPKSREAVENALNELNYTPNFLARSLASKKKFTFFVVIPAYQPGEYWEKIYTGIKKAADEFSMYNVSLKMVYYDQYDNQSFKGLEKKLISADTNAVLLTPFFKKESLSLTEKLAKHQIPFSFLDSMIEHVDFISYYGQDSFQSGYIAAKLMFEKQTDIQKVLIVRTKRKGESFSNQTEQRLLGFKHYMQHQQLNNIELIHHECSYSDAEKEISDLKMTLDKHPDILGAITFNSKAYKLADQLNQLHQNKIKLIGYDLLSENVKYLKEGKISYLIAQQPVKQAYFAIRDLCRKFVFHQEINKINFMPVDILIRENIDYYINFDEII